MEGVLELDAEMEDVVVELVRVMKEERRRRRREPMPPLPDGATPEQVDGLAEALGGQVPPSYAAFLRLHDGWPEFSGHAMILPTTERGKPWVGERLQWFHELLEEDGEQEILDDSFVVVLGPDERDFVLFDLRERDDDGELEVVHWDLGEGELARYCSFLEFLQDSVDVVAGDD